MTLKSRLGACFIGLSCFPVVEFGFIELTWGLSSIRKYLAFMFIPNMSVEGRIALVNLAAGTVKESSLFGILVELHVALLFHYKFRNNYLRNKCQ